MQIHHQKNLANCAGPERIPSTCWWELNMRITLGFRRQDWFAFIYIHFDSFLLYHQLLAFISFFSLLISSIHFGLLTSAHRDALESFNPPCRILAKDFHWVIDGAAKQLGAQLADWDSISAGNCSWCYRLGRRWNWFNTSNLGDLSMTT